MPAVWIGGITAFLSKWNEDNSARVTQLAKSSPEAVSDAQLDDLYGEFVSADPKYKLTDTQKSVWKAGVINDWKTSGDTWDTVIARWSPGGNDGVYAGTWGA